jgi:ribosomal protein S18 acetylase RimI-like enzyme
MTMSLRSDKDLPVQALVDLYNAVNWLAYTNDPDSLHQAVCHSTCVITAWEDDQLIGLVRALSDGVAILYVQDILVHPDHQHKGVGRRLLTEMLGRYPNVRAKVLLTDDEDRQKRFYESMGFTNTRDVKSFTLNAYVSFETRAAANEE